MKKQLFLSAFLFFAALGGFAQGTFTIAVEYYVDANSNCAYDPGEQIVYNVPTSISFSQTTGTVVTSVNQSSFTGCAGPTLYCWNVSVPPVNTVVPMGSGIIPNPCGTFNNLPYNSNTVQYLPVILTGTSNLGVNMNMINYSSMAGGAVWQNVASGDTISLCSNFGLDSLFMNMNINNFLSCNNSNTLAPRTYSFYFDNVLYDQFTVSGGLNSSNNAVGVNSMVSGWEFYTGGTTYLSIGPDLPATFSVMGTHTFEIQSSMIYNSAASVVNYKCYINSVPCSKISGQFYNDCNNNCIYDAGDSYGVGQYATGLLYNSSGVNVTFNPNPWDGSFSVFMPATSAYSLTQYPTSPGTFTACTSGTVTIPAAAGTNTFLFGYQNSLPANADPGVYIYRTASTSNIISPLVGVTFGYQFNNYMNNLFCNSNGVLNPGLLKITLPKFINYVSTLSGPTPTLSAGATLDTLIYSIPNFSNALQWWINPVGTFSAVVSATAVANTQFAITAYIYPQLDINLLNNTYSWQRIIGGPFDPNGKYLQVKTMKPNGDVPFGTQDFVYEIGFQNIGNAPAINITTLDTIDNNFELSSLRVLQSSYPVSFQTDYVSRTVAFHFDNISLPGAQVNEPASHGFVRYSIKLKPNVPVNTVLRNRAHNYFDLLEGVATNQTNNKLVVSTAISENGTPVSFVKAVPNPFNHRLLIQAGEKISDVSVHNLSGQLLVQVAADSEVTELDLSNFAAGIYLVKVKCSNGNVSTIKVVKE